MKTRAAAFVAATIAAMLSSASLAAAPDDVEQQADKNAERQADPCLTAPRDYTPPGTRWRYRIERSAGRHCWYLKDDVEKTVRRPSGQATVEAAEPPAAPPRKKSPAPRSPSDARAELSQTLVEQEVRPAPAADARVAESNRPSAARSADMPAPAAATRWPDPMSAANPAANPPASPAAPADRSTDVRPAPASPAAKPQIMPRAVPPIPLSEKPLSTPMLITIIVGGLSVLGVMASLLFAWLGSRRARRSPGVPMPPPEMPGQPRRSGDLYRERKQQRARKTGRRAA